MCFDARNLESDESVGCPSFSGGGVGGGEL